MAVVAGYHGRRRRATAVHGTGGVGVEPLRALVERSRSSAVPPERRADAFAELVRRYQDLVYGYAYSLLGDRGLAQDAAQEAFLAASRCRSSTTPTPYPAGCAASRGPTACG